MNEPQLLQGIVFSQKGKLSISKCIGVFLIVAGAIYLTFNVIVSINK